MHTVTKCINSLVHDQLLHIHEISTCSPQTCRLVITLDYDIIKDNALGHKFCHIAMYVASYDIFVEFIAMIII